MTTHFIAIYSVPCINAGTGIKRKDYCESGVREMRFLNSFLKSVGSDIVAVFKIKYLN
jgi:hypothetical protein